MPSVSRSDGASFWEDRSAATASLAHTCSTAVVSDSSEANRSTRGVGAPASPAGDAGAPTPRVDLFASLESLTTAVEQVCASEAVAAERSSQNDAPSLRETLGKPGVLPALLRAGHGVALAHVHAPYLCVAFHMPAAALQLSLIHI